MKSRGVVGKRIVKIHQSMEYPRNHPKVMDVYGIDLEDGTMLTPTTCEGETEYYVEVMVRKPKKK